MKRRDAQSSALSFIDCICCGFGAVLLLFILTAKSQIVESRETATQALAAEQTVQQAIEQATAKQKALDKDIAALDPQPKANSTTLAQLAAEQTRLAKAVEDQSDALAALDSESKDVDAIAGLNRPSADQSYLSGLRLRGPRAVILLESSGSMLATDAQSALEIIRNGSGATAEKWLRAKAAVRAVIAAIPQGTKVAVFHMNERTCALSGSPKDPYIDPYENAALLATLERLDTLEASGGSDLTKALRIISGIQQRPSSLLLISDGLPSAPNPSQRSLTEADRVKLFNAAMATRPNYPFNTILLPFDGDPSAAGLYWKLSARTNGITLIPDNDWPTL
jgi:hypothetical protein